MKKTILALSLVLFSTSVAAKGKCSLVDTADQAIEQHLNNSINKDKWGSFNVVESSGDRYKTDVFILKNEVRKIITIKRAGKKFRCDNN